MSARQHSEHRRHHVLIALALLTLVSTSCGTRVVREAAGQQAATQAPVASPSGDASANSPIPTVEDSESAVTAAPTAPVGASPGSGGGRSAAPGQSVAGAAQASPQNRPAVGPAASNAPAEANTVPTTPRPPQGGGAPPAAPAARSRLLIANVGTLSGPVGSATVPILQGAQTWVKFINQKGGLNGHHVDLIVYDDGGDPARHRSQVQEAIEKKGAVAFLANGDVVAGHASMDYITQKRIPVIGTDTGNELAYQSPMYFLQASSGRASMYSYLAGAAQVALPRGKKTLGTLVCAEAQTCSDAEGIYARSAERLGFKYTYRGKASIAQPDFTAECISARNAGVEVLIFLFDQNSTSRFAASCARQGYRPILSIASQVANEGMTKDPKLSGTIAAVAAFPFFQSGTPATDEYQAAIRTLAPRLVKGTGPTLGWVAGKLLEKAGQNLPEPPTSEAILKGLWSLKNDTLGGLTQPLTFVEGQLSPQLACWFNIELTDEGWVSPDRMQQHCENTPA